MLTGLLVTFVVAFFAVLGIVLTANFRKTPPPGVLRFGASKWMGGLGCLAFALFPVLITQLGNDRDFWWKVGMSAAFAIAGIATLAEAIFVRGTYSKEGIDIATPWTGRKVERWQDLVAINDSVWTSWTTLVFKGGRKIRLDNSLRGFQEALDMAYKKSKVKDQRRRDD